MRLNFNPLRKLIDKTEIKHKVFAKNIGITPQSLSRKLQGDEQMSLIVAVKIANELQVRLEEIFFIEDWEPRKIKEFPETD